MHGQVYRWFYRKKILKGLFDCTSLTDADNVFPDCHNCNYIDPVFSTIEGSSTSVVEINVPVSLP